MIEDTYPLLEVKLLTRHVYLFIVTTIRISATLCHLRTPAMTKAKMVHSNGQRLSA